MHLPSKKIATLVASQAKGSLRFSLLDTQKKIEENLGIKNFDFFAKIFEYPSNFEFSKIARGTQMCRDSQVAVHWK